MSESTERKDEERARELLIRLRAPVYDEDPQASLAKAFAEVRREERERCANVAESESEPSPDDAPLNLNVEYSAVEVAIGSVRATKKAIARRIRALPNPGGKP